MPIHCISPNADLLWRSGRLLSEYHLESRQLAPPVVVNVREDRSTATDPNARDLLREDEIRYFRQYGNNATIFIHGFSVSYGTFARQVELKDWHHDILRNQTKPVRLAYGETCATTYRDQKLLDGQYRRWHERHPDLYADIDLKRLNGGGAHSWFLHMEDNLNRATGQFDRSDYQKYTRMIHLAWSGDVFDLDYMAAETNANQAGFALAGLIDQLVGEGIAVNVIAHSLGNRVLLVAMNLLGQMPGRRECIAHAFMWQPAVPDTALSNDPGRDTSVLRNWNFIHAHRAAKKIVVLYSDQDNILGPYRDDDSLHQDRAADQEIEAASGTVGGIYRVATQAGVPGTQMMFAPWSVCAHYLHNLNVDNLPKIEQALHEQIAQDANGLFTDHLVPRRHEYLLPALGPLLYLRRITREIAEDAMKTFRALAHADYEIKLPRPAMGYGGPEMEEDLFLQRLESEGKLALVNQSRWLFDHSGMKIPSELLFEKVYDMQIMQRMLRDTGFGRY
jgi:hypothetical protein